MESGAVTKKKYTKKDLRLSQAEKYHIKGHMKMIPRLKIVYKDIQQAELLDDFELSFRASYTGYFSFYKKFLHYEKKRKTKQWVFFLLKQNNAQHYADLRENLAMTKLILLKHCDGLVKLIGELDQYYQKRKVLEKSRFEDRI